MLPHELVARFVIPYLRALVALALYERGFSQNRIAKLLNLTQPMISRYISEGVEHHLAKLRDLGIPIEEVQAVVRVLAETLARGRKHDYMRIMTSYVNTLLKRGYLCKKHRELEPDIVSGCTLCKRIFLSISDPYIDELLNAFEILKTHRRAYMLVPEVGMNIVVATPDASSISEVVGFSGRIVRVGEDIVAVGEPMYGGSRHTATVLLIARRHHPDIRAAIVIRYIGGCAEKLRFKGLNVAHTGPHEDPSRFYIDLEEVFKKAKHRIDVLVDLGGKGLEPVIYIFGSNAVDVAKAAIECLE